MINLGKSIWVSNYHYDNGSLYILVNKHVNAEVWNLICSHVSFWVDDWAAVRNVQSIILDINQEGRNKLNKINLGEATSESIVRRTYSEVRSSFTKYPFYNNFTLDPVYDFTNRSVVNSIYTYVRLGPVE